MTRVSKKSAIELGTPLQPREAKRRGPSRHVSPTPLEGLLVDVETAAPALYVDLIGEVDIATRQHLNMLNSVPLTNVTMILLDLSQVDYRDTSGIRTLINLRHEQLRAGRQVWITRLTPRVR